MSTDVLPNLVIAGVPKAGTTSLFNYLAQHTDVCASDVKELDYFTPLRAGEPPEPLESYRRHFAHHRGEAVVMEASPSYCYSGQPVIDGLRSTLPEARIIISLRDPVGRLWSAYTSHSARGNLLGVTDFDDYVQRCLREREAGTDRELGNRLIAVSVGFYEEYLPAWLDAYGERLRVVFSDQLGDAPQLVASLCRWLGIDDGEAARFDYSVQNRTREVRSPVLGRLAQTASKATRRIGRDNPLRRAAAHAYARTNTRPVSESMSPGTRGRLVELYAASNAATAAALRRHGYEALPPWLSGVPQP